MYSFIKIKYYNHLTENYVILQKHTLLFLNIIKICVTSIEYVVEFYFSSYISESEILYSTTAIHLKYQIHIEILNCNKYNCRIGMSDLNKLVHE